jgi:hypothetical protein
MMLPRVTSVRHIKDFQLAVDFSDGTTAVLDFRRRILGRGGVFRQLEDVATFAQVAVDPEAGTLVWPNGVDFCPDVLYAEAIGRDVNELPQPVEVV